MKVIIHTPPPRENTYDIVGLSEDEMALLDALLGRLNTRGDVKSTDLWQKIRAARNHDGHVRDRIEIKDLEGLQSVILSAWKVQ